MNRLILLLMLVMLFPVMASAQDWRGKENGGKVQVRLGQNGSTAYFKFSGVVKSSTLLIGVYDTGWFCVNPNVDTAVANGVTLTLDELIGEIEDDNHFSPYESIVFTGIGAVRCVSVPPGRYRVNVTAISGGSGLATMRRIRR